MLRMRKSVAVREKEWRNKGYRCEEYHTQRACNPTQLCQTPCQRKHSCPYNPCHYVCHCTPYISWSTSQITSIIHYNCYKSLLFMVGFMNQREIWICPQLTFGLVRNFKFLYCLRWKIGRLWTWEAHENSMTMNQQTCVCDSLTLRSQFFPSNTNFTRITLSSSFLT